MIRPRYLLAVLVVVGIGAAFVSTTSGSRRGRQAIVPVSPAALAEKPDPFASPAAVYAAFREAVAAKDWRREFECYTPKRQAQFSYGIIGTAFYLEFEMDLFVQVEAALARHGLAEADLSDVLPDEEFGGRILTPENEEELIRSSERKYEEALRRWETVVFPKIKDPAALVATLEPLIREGVRRRPHEGDGSRISMSTGSLDGYAYGRLQALQVNGDQATAKIRIKTLFGRFVEPESLDEQALDDDESNVADATTDNTREPNVVLSDASGLYTWVWEAAARIKSIAGLVPESRLVYVALPNGDFTIGPDVDEGQEWGASNNGTRTATTGDVKFRRVNGQWRIEEVDYR